MANRLSPIERGQLPENERRFHDAVKAIRGRPISGPFITLMNSSPDLAARFAHLGHYFHARGQADESILALRVRSFIALVGARALDATYEWAAWVGWAIEAGVPRETVDASRDRRPLAHLTPEDALVLELCTQLMTGDHRVSDTTYGAALRHFGMQRLIELVATLGYFSMIAFPLNAFEMEMTTAQRGQREPFAPLPIAEWTAPAPQQRDGNASRVTRSPAQRVPLVRSHSDMPGEHHHFFDRVIRTRGTIPGPFQVLLGAPDMAERIAHVGELILYGTILAPAASALAALIAAAELDCEYLRAAALPRARKAGLSQSLIEALGNRNAPADLTKEERLVADFCYQLLRGNHRIREDSYRAALEHFGTAAAVQLAASLGYYVMMAFVTNAFEIDPGAEEEPGL